MLQTTPVGGVWKTTGEILTLTTTFRLRRTFPTMKHFLYRRLWKTCNLGNGIYDKRVRGGLDDRHLAGKSENSRRASVRKGACANVMTGLEAYLLAEWQ
jgi:hypothetical protein